VRAFEYRFDRPDVPDPPDVRLFQGGAEPFLLGRFGQPRYGVELVEVNPELGAYFGTDRGVLVTDVTEGSALGLEPGDIILRVGDRDVTSPDRVLRILATYSDDEQVSFRVRRDGREIDVLGRLEG
jgi:S1-C subfamily serine protease